jgi:hypothetical protein
LNYKQNSKTENKKKKKTEKRNGEEAYLDLPDAAAQQPSPPEAQPQPSPPYKPNPRTRSK